MDRSVHFRFAQLFSANLLIYKRNNISFFKIILVSKIKRWDLNSQNKLLRACLIKIKSKCFSSQDFVNSYGRIFFQSFPRLQTRFHGQNILRILFLIYNGFSIYNFGLGLGLTLWDARDREFWLSKSRPVGHKLLGLFGLGQKLFGQSRDFELWDFSPRDENCWDWLSRPSISLMAVIFWARNFYLTKFQFTSSYLIIL